MHVKPQVKSRLKGITVIGSRVSIVNVIEATLPRIPSPLVRSNREVNVPYLPQVIDGPEEHTLKSSSCSISGLSLSHSLNKACEWCI
jgi:hypothetical protein